MVKNLPLKDFFLIFTTGVGLFIFTLMIFNPHPVRAAEETRTVIIPALQDSSARNINSPTQTSFTFFMGDEIQGVESAFFEVTGSSGASSNQQIKLSLDDDEDNGNATDFSRLTSKTFSINTAGNYANFKILYDVKNILGSTGTDRCAIKIRGNYTCYLSVDINNADTASVYGLSAKLAVTYRFIKLTNQGTDNTRTISMFALQDAAPRAQADAATLTPFSFFMGDDIQGVESAFFEITGSSAATSAQNIKLSLDDDSDNDDSNDFSAPIAKTFQLNTSGSIANFKILYDVKNVLGSAGSDRCAIKIRGNYTCYLSVDINNADTASVYGLSAKLAVTYRFKPPSGGSANIPAWGTYTSPTYDSKVASDDAGGAISKSGFNTIRWIEDVSGGTGTLVKSITIAVNNNDATWNYYGGDGTSNETACEGANTCYARSNATYCSSTSLGANRYEVLCRIAPAQQNFRYFRYKIKLCNEKTSPSQCSGGNGNNTSKVEKVILNWSP